MVIKIKDPQNPNKEIEVFTKEDVDAAVKSATDTATSAATKVAEEKTTQAIEQFKKDNPDRSTEIQTLQDSVKELTAKLEQAEKYGSGGGNGGGRDEQIERLRKERDEAVSGLTKKVEELTKTITSMGDNQKSSTVDTLLDQFAGNDPKVREKVKFEFENYRPNDMDSKAMTERMKMAAHIAGAGSQEKPGTMDGAGNGGKKGEGNYGGGPQVVTAGAVAVGKQMGVTEEELKKAAEIINNTNQNK